jgi:hypothetical protein
VLVAMGVFHRWWLYNSGGCSGVVCSKSGADLQGPNNNLHHLGHVVAIMVAYQLSLLPVSTLQAVAHSGGGHESSYRSVMSIQQGQMITHLTKIPALAYPHITVTGTVLPGYSIAQVQQLMTCTCTCAYL